jgi:excisionase family DNA binding protein
LLTDREAAEVLRVSPRTLWGLMKAGEVRVIRIGRAVRYPVSELEAFIRRQLAAQSGQGGPAA